LGAMFGAGRGVVSNRGARGGDWVRRMYSKSASLYAACKFANLHFTSLVQSVIGILPDLL
jgi:hypothetical protein